MAAGHEFAVQGFAVELGPTAVATAKGRPAQAFFRWDTASLNAYSGYIGHLCARVCAGVNVRIVQNVTYCPS
ncbi:hypothetical protein GCM10010358_59140 [Streptomyces minutiscleroticus]|uniref:Uncharacterized protein n=1 Tax=Streptomyces minutiscleroticus TaxID=68238 RepID=A0A918NUY2_9ACTN|nr:hypothetical protein GCM10010358_59140 [Streptomyces minutiscleroticus]